MRDRRSAATAVGLAALVLATRLAHLDLLWVEEAYGLAAARELLRGKHLYSQIWFDKPPVYAWFYTLCGGEPGLALRLLDTGFVLLCIWCVWLTARTLSKDTNAALMAAVLTCVGLTFYIPASVIAVTPDLLVLPPLTLTVWAAASGRAWSAGIFAALALLANSKGVIALPLAAVWLGRDFLKSLASFAAVQLASLAILPVSDYLQEVWIWGARYSADTFVAHPIREGLTRTAAWLGFHLTAVIGAVCYLIRRRDARALAWLALAALTVVAGLRFFPRYYFMLLPAVCITGAMGLRLMPARARLAALALLVVPIARFGPRYVSLALHGPDNWSDAALMQDSQVAAAIVREAAPANSTILVWGYRPEIAVWSGLPEATRYLDSQPLTGVIADRHLTNSRATFPDLARANRIGLARMNTPPDILVDGLGPINPNLGPDQFPELAGWFLQYERIGATKASVIYRLKK